MATFRFELITPEGIKFKEDVYELLLPTPNGTIGILPNHAPLITLASPGVIFVRRKQGDPETAFEHLAVSGGLIEVSHNRVCFLADTAEHADAIDELRAKEALERARELATTAKDHVSLADATALIERNIARLETVELRRRHRPGHDRQPSDIHLHRH